MMMMISPRPAPVYAVKDLVSRYELAWLAAIGVCRTCRLAEQVFDVLSSCAAELQLTTCVLQRVKHTRVARKRLGRMWSVASVPSRSSLRWLIWVVWVGCPSCTIRASNNRPVCLRSSSILSRFFGLDYVRISPWWWPWWLVAIVEE
jgi:hypothetical protein